MGERNMKKKILSVLLLSATLLVVPVISNGQEVSNVLNTDLQYEKPLEIEQYGRMKNGHLCTTTSKENGEFIVQEIVNGKRAGHTHLMVEKTRKRHTAKISNSATYCYKVWFEIISQCKTCGEEAIVVTKAENKKHVYQNGKCTRCGRKKL